MKATEILMNEHRVIEQVLACLEKMVEIGEREGRVDPADASNAVAFFRNFADRCHHAKEEEQLFPMMETRGFSPQQGPTAVMRVEHEQGRALVGRIEAAIAGAAAGDTKELRAFADAARSYVLLLRDHIQKEDHCLFPMAEQALGDPERAELLRRFEHVERHDLGEGTHDKFVRIADELAERYGVERAKLHGVAGGVNCGH